MKHKFTQKVYHSDTDAYAHVWHGSYLKWMEAGRVEFCEMLGYNLVELQGNDIVLPVVNINIRYKSSAKLNDKVIIETSIKKFTPLSVTFHQVTKSEEGNVFTSADVDVVAVHNDGNLYRRMPKILYEAFEKAGVECD